MAENLSKRLFHGKLLLFGEHSVIDGSKALVVPFEPVTAIFEFPDEKYSNRSITKSNHLLRAFAVNLQDNRDHHTGMQALDLKRFRRDIDMGLYFRSTIPGGYGLGSSGALCAAVYHEYATAYADDMLSDQSWLMAVRSELASMESYFHGQSSGIDPLCIYFNKPLVVEGKSSIVPWPSEDYVETELQVFLLDTGQASRTGDMVTVFRKKLQEQHLKESFTRQYIPLVNHIVDQFRPGNPSFEFLLALSVFQLRLFQDMIPENYRSVWQYGIDSEYYACKLCGSGGGGYILGFTENFDNAKKSLAARFNLIPVRLDIF
jgi:mevalonate kinase